MIYSQQFVFDSNTRKFIESWSLRLTWESFNPNRSANFFLSGLLMYFWIWKRFSKPFRCESKRIEHKRKERESSKELFWLSINYDIKTVCQLFASLPENTARRIIPRRGFPRVECAHGNPCPANTEITINSNVYMLHDIVQRTWGKRENLRPTACFRMNETKCCD